MAYESPYGDLKKGRYEMKKIIGLLILVPFVSLGEVEPIIISLSGTNWVHGTYGGSGDTSYTVPQGKVLVIESLVTDYGSAHLSIISGGYTNAVVLPSSFPRSYKLPSGTTLVTFDTWSRAVMFCLLVDEKDFRSLYANKTRTDRLITGSIP